VPQLVLPDDQSVLVLPATARLTTVAFSQKLKMWLSDCDETEPPTCRITDCAPAHATRWNSSPQRRARTCGVGPELSTIAGGVLAVFSSSVDLQELPGVSIAMVALRLLVGRREGV
jgi:hypothetical protein